MFYNNYRLQQKQLAQKMHTRNDLKILDLMGKKGDYNSLNRKLIGKQKYVSKKCKSFHRFVCIHVIVESLCVNDLRTIWYECSFK